MKAAWAQSLRFRLLAATVAGLSVALLLAGVALGSLFHYVTKGPNAVSKEIEDDIEREDKEEAK